MQILNSVIIPLASAFIGGAFSVWLFNKGLDKKKEQEKLDRIKNNFETEEYFFYNISSLLFFLDKQIEQISETSKQTKNWYNKNLTLATFSELKMTELIELNFKTLFQILVIDRTGDFESKAKDFINIKNCLHNIEDFLDRYKIENQNSHIEANKYSDSWNNSIKSLSQIYNSYIFLKPEKGDMLMPILEKYIVIEQRKLIKNGTDQNIEEFYKKIILPFKNEILAYKNPNDQRVLPIIEHISECHKSYILTKTLRHQKRKGFITSGRRLIRIKQILEESKNSIQKRKKRIE